MPGATALPVLLAISFCHLLNDMMQALLPAMYPMLKASFALDFTPDRPDHPHVPAHGLAAAAADRALHRPSPQAVLADARHGVHARGAGMPLGGPELSRPDRLRRARGARARRSSIPESSRVARMASGGRHGLAQSLFQVGGNTGSAIGPLVAAFIVLPRGQSSVAWFSVAALLAIAVLWRVGRWYQHHRARVAAIRADARPGSSDALARPGAARARCADRADLLQVRLPHEHLELLHLLSDPPLRHGRPERAAPPVRLPGRGGRRHHHRRPGGRPVRPEAGDLVLDPRRPAVHARPAVRESGLDRRAERRRSASSSPRRSRRSWSTRRSWCPARSG